ncbi:MAG: hypothetical protein ACOYNY_36445 [Caldilineaceae bacterium]
MKDSQIITGSDLLSRLPSAFFLAPINTGLAINGEPSEPLIQFHSERSGHKIGISYIGNVAIDPKYVTNSGTLYFTNSTSHWNKLTDIIHKNGSLAGIQIGCRNTRLQPPRNWKGTNVNNYIDTTSNEMLSYNKSHIIEIVEKFVDCAIDAYNTGFDVIQLHAAHGYFLSNLINPRLNIRDDEFGIENLGAIKLIVDGIRHRLPKIILDIRISYLDGLEKSEVEKVDKYAIIKKIASMNVDIISVSNGTYDINKQLIYPPTTWGHGVYIDLVLPFAIAHPNIIWNVAGNIWNLSQLPNNLPSNLSFSVGRSLIADPQFIEKSLNNNDGSIAQCTRSNFCHYYSRGLQHITCPVYERSKTRISIGD